ncbi:hypothetical protein GGR56DRAFT_56786 [Xylariaceae sp. FL0804]|nr:hypothetical protein GGR56DRAFT_56786 [Xylariaceae sp. FL0804]
MKDLSPSGAKNFAAMISMFALGAVAVVLRMAVRFSLRTPNVLSEILIILSLTSFAVYAGLGLHYIVAGPGPATFDLNQIVAEYANGGKVWGKALIKTLYVTDLFFGLTITLVKLSILMLYFGIFSVSKRFQRATYIVGGICVAWFIVFLFINIFQCQPISALWETFGAAQYCIANGPLWLGFELTNLLLDVLILVLPVSMLRQLQLAPVQKRSVAGIFLLGGLVCVASIIRITYIWHPADIQVVDISHTEIWSSIQLGTAILCACLPCYGPILRAGLGAMKHGMSALGMAVSTQSGRSAHSQAAVLSGSKGSTKRDLSSSPYYRIDGRSGVERDIEVSAWDDQHLALNDLPSRSIMVHKSVHVT